jgi:hypothetical protein
MKFNSQICTSRKQSKRLLALGLKKETADCHWANFALFEDYEVFVIHAGNPDDEDDIPAWSLHRLIEMYVERYISCSMNLKDLTYEWIINEIETHIKEGDFNKEYLEE